MTKALRTGAPLAAALALTVLLPLSAHASGPRPLPYRMADTGGARQLITAVADRTASTAGTLTWWQRDGSGRWHRRGAAPARFGSGGLTEGRSRVQGTNTTPTGLYGLPYAFGTEHAPPGARIVYRPVTDRSWWCEDNRSRAYNRWSEPRAADCRASEAEHLADYAQQYAHALVTDFNYRHPVRGRGAGIFLHVNGAGATAGCVSVPKDTMRRLLRWVRPGARIAVGTEGGRTGIERY